MLFSAFGNQKRRVLVERGPPSASALEECGILERTKGGESANLLPILDIESKVVS